MLRSKDCWQCQKMKQKKKEKKEQNVSKSDSVFPEPSVILTLWLWRQIPKHRGKVMSISTLVGKTHKPLH